jgi:hypothetical protein
MGDGSVRFSDDFIAIEACRGLATSAQGELPTGL